MAKKTENELKYLQMPIPSSRKCYKMTKRSWQGLNLRQTIDSGALSMENNISTAEAPYLVPSMKPEKYTDVYENPIGLFGFDDFLIMIYRIDTAIYVDYITANDYGYVDKVYTGTLQASGATYSDEYPRCVVQFNVYDTPTDPLEGEYINKLLIFPDKKSMDFEITDDFTISDMSVLVKTYYNDTEEDDGTYPPPSSASHSYYYKNTYNQDVYRWVDDESDSENSGWKVSMPPAMPGIKYATVHLSRLFGVDDTRVYASGYNDYTNWNFDTVDEYNESNAWCSSAQSNTRAGGVFTGITNFQGHIICFKNDYMHEIYNTKNPFRIQDIFAEGAIDHRTIQDVDGKLIFVSKDNVKIYTGSNPRIISYNLNISQYLRAISGTDGRNYYLYCKTYDGEKLFIYDTFIEQWSEQCVDGEVLSFAHNQNGMYMLLDDGYVYQLDTNSYNHDWSFETDLITNETVDIKHIKKIQMLADLKNSASKLRVYVLYDDEEFDEDTSHLVYKSSGYGRKTIRVKPRQTASYGIKLHIEGYGYVKLYELELFMENGGDLYV